MNESKTTVTTFQFRLNGLIIPLLKVRPVMLDGVIDYWSLSLATKHSVSSPSTITTDLLMPNSRDSY